MEKEISYQKAYQELEQIVEAIENDQPGIDELSEMIHRAAALVTACKKKLRDTEAEMLQIFDDLDQSES